ncbi:unnamed protein product [Heterobilharzia americana]|nr:unnamed protein product [Heterobilharzia americana]
MQLKNLFVKHYMGNFDDYQYKDFGCGLSDKNGEILEYILSEMNKHSPRRYTYRSFPKKTALSRNGMQNAGTQVVCKHKCHRDGKCSAVDGCLYLSNNNQVDAKTTIAEQFQADLNKMMHEMAINWRKMESNIQNDDLGTTTPFYLTDHPFLINVLRNQKETSDSMSNQKDSACESENLSSIADDLYSLRNSFEFLKPKSHQSLPKITNDSQFSSTMWQKVTELWNRLMQEERLFWQGQLLSKTKFNYSDDEVIDKKSLLNDINLFHTEELRTLWKQIYESWVPRDYLQYFSDETRKVFVNLNLVIEKLLSFVEKSNHDTSSLRLHCKLESLRTSKCDSRQYTVNHQQWQQPYYARRNSLYINAPKMSKRLSHSCSSIDKIFNSSEPSNDHLSFQGESRINFNQIRELLKMRCCHQQLLEQIYHVTEIVSAALDTDMEDAINGAYYSVPHACNNNECKTFEGNDVLINPSAPGLQVVAKLHSAILDLETRLDTMYDNQIVAENITNSCVDFECDRGAGHPSIHKSYSFDYAQNTKESSGICSSELSNTNELKGTLMNVCKKLKLINIVEDKREMERCETESSNRDCKRSVECYRISSDSCN